MGFDIWQFLENMDEEEAMEMMGEVDEEQVTRGIQWFMQEAVLPHLDDIRQRANDAPPAEKIREDLRTLPEEEQEEVFYETLDSLIATLVNCRENPEKGFRQLKTMLRDPHTSESLLLIFQNEKHINPDYSDQMKEFGAEHLRWAGAMVLPEMYDPAEVQAVMENFDVDPDPDVDGFSTSEMGQ